MRKRRLSDAVDMRPHTYGKDGDDAERAGWDDAPPPVTVWSVMRILFWVGVVALVGTVLLNVADAARAKTHEVYRARDVAVEELKQDCCRMMAGAALEAKKAASCAAILAEEKRVRGISRCEAATEILAKPVALEIVAAVWRHFVPFGNVSLAEMLAQMGISAFTTYLGQHALRRVLPL